MVSSLHYISNLRRNCHNLMFVIEIVKCYFSSDGKVELNFDNYLYCLILTWYAFGYLKIDIIMKCH